MEEFRQIKDFENYEISNKGNVRNKITNRTLKNRFHTKVIILLMYRNKIKEKHFTFTDLLQLLS